MSCVKQLSGLQPGSNKHVCSAKATSSLQWGQPAEPQELRVTPSPPHTRALGMGREMVVGPGKVPQPLGTGRLWGEGGADFTADYGWRQAGKETREGRNGHASLLLPASLVRSMELVKGARQQGNLEFVGSRSGVGRLKGAPVWDSSGIQHPLWPWAPLKPTSPSCQRSPAKNGAEQIFLE